MSYLSRAVSFRCFAFTIVVILAASPVLRAGDGPEGIQWSTDIEASLQKAAAAQQPVLMEFTASWCVYCKRMEQTTFVDPAVAAHVNGRFVAIKVDADQHKGLVKDLGIKGLPAMLVVSPDLQIIERISGFQTPEALLSKLEAAVPSPAISPAPVVADLSRPVAMQTSNAFEPNPFAEASLPAPAPADNAGRASLAGSPAVEPAVAENPFATFEKAPAPQLEAPLAFEGHCPVAAIDDRKIQDGKAAYEIVYRGRTVRFSSLEARISFEADPNRYWPMLDGSCPLTLSRDGVHEEGDLRYAVMFRKRLWLLNDEQSMNAFVDAPADVVQAALIQLQATAVQ